MTPSRELTAEQLAAEINRWANQELLGAKNFTFDEVLTRVTAMASRMLGEPVKLINPRMEDHTMLADGFLLLRPIESIYISAELKTPDPEIWACSQCGRDRHGYIGKGNLCRYCAQEAE